MSHIHETEKILSVEDGVVKTSPWYHVFIDHPYLTIMSITIVLSVGVYIYVTVVNSESLPQHTFSFLDYLCSFSESHKKFEALINKADIVLRTENSVTYKMEYLKLEDDLIALLKELSFLRNSGYTFYTSNLDRMINSLNDILQNF